MTEPSPGQPPEPAPPSPAAGRPRLVVMARLPRPGQAKTRLIPALGPAGAARLHARLTERTLAVARQAALTQGWDLEVRVTGGAPAAARAWLGEGPLYRDQGEGDVGERMARCLAEALAEGAPAAAVVGTDLPELTPDVLAQGGQALARGDLALGPAADGGYYFIGLTRSAPELFQGLAWGGDQVAARTLELARAHGFTPALLPRLADLDRPADLPRWAAARAREQGRLAVLIPALNEEAALPSCLARVAAGGADLVVVADGGSADATRAVAARAGALVLSCPRGRARQMNAAARLATAEYLLFLHADTLLPPGWAAEVRRVLADPGVAAGAFTFRLDQRPASLRFIELAVALRCRLAGLPYGDQGLFLRREDFQQLGGFPDQPIMEDWELVRRLGRQGRVVISPLPAVTSARRWQELGLARTTFLNYLVPMLYHLGLEPARLRRLYDRRPSQRLPAK